MRLSSDRKDNLLCLRALTAATLKNMETYNYRGFVGAIERKGDYYVIVQVTGNPPIAGAGDTIESAIDAFQKSVRMFLRETAKDSQKKMLVRKFEKMENIHKRVRELSEQEIARQIKQGKLGKRGK